MTFGPSNSSTRTLVDVYVSLRIFDEELVPRSSVRISLRMHELKQCRIKRAVLVLIAEFVFKFARNKCMSRQWNLDEQI